jgi:K+-transporting ATPase KdpF subunit
VSASEREPMILLTAVVTVLLFIYLLAALLRPEWF